MQAPLFFVSFLGIFSFLAGFFGLFVADMAESALLDRQNLAFPVGQLVHKMISTQNQIRKAYELMVGFCATVFFSFLQGGIILSRSFIPKTITLVPAVQCFIFSLPRLVVNLDTTPMIWAIGFVTGHVIALPLAAGAVTSIFLVNPVQRIFFAHLSPMEFTLAFCSGIVLCITLMSIIGMPQQVLNSIKNLITCRHANQMKNYCNPRLIAYGIMIVAGLLLFFSYFGFPWYVQLYLIVCSTITTYQIAAIAGRIGLALLGRFATFVMVPAMLMFNINYVHMVLIATFVEMSGGVAADVLFGRKLRNFWNFTCNDATVSVTRLSC